MALELVNKLPYDHPYRWDGTLFGGPKLWRPDELGASLSLWLDAEDTSTITLNGSTVSQWSDKSSNAIPFSQPTASRQPSYGVSGLAKNTLNFDGVDDVLDGDDVLDAVWTGSAFQIFFVAKNNAADNSNGTILSKVSNSPLDLRQFVSNLRTNRSQLVTLYNPGVTDYTGVNGSTVIANGQWVISSQAYTDTGTGSANTTDRVEIVVDGSEETEVVAFYSGTLQPIKDTEAHLSVGANVADGTQLTGLLNGSVGEVIVTSTITSLADRQKLEGYLAWKWGLEANLPAGHPYKSAPPTVLTIANPPSVLVAPVVSGTVEIGQTLSTTDGSWTNSPTSYTYQWQRDGVDISGATSATYTVVAADIGPGTGGVGTGIRCVVTATNGSGSGTPEPSNAMAFDHASYLPDTAIWANAVAGHGITTADAGTTGDSWQSRWGGVSCLLEAPASTHRPAYATDGVGSRPTLTFDGSDDFLRGSFTKGSAFDDHEIGIVGERVSFGTLGDIWFGYWFPNSAAFYLNDQDAPRFRFTSLGAANVTPSSTYDPDGVLAHYSADAVTGTISVRVGGTSVASAAASPISRADGNTVIMGASQTSVGGPYGTVASNVKLHAAHIGPALTTDQRTHLRALLTYLTGVSC